MRLVSLLLREGLWTNNERVTILNSLDMMIKGLVISFSGALKFLSRILKYGG